MMIKFSAVICTGTSIAFTFKQDNTTANSIESVSNDLIIVSIAPDSVKEILLNDDIVRLESLNDDSRNITGIKIKEHFQNVLPTGSYFRIDFRRKTVSPKSSPTNDIRLKAVIRSLEMRNANLLRGSELRRGQLPSQMGMVLKSDKLYHPMSPPTQIIEDVSPRTPATVSTLFNSISPSTPDTKCSGVQWTLTGSGATDVESPKNEGLSRSLLHTTASSSSFRISPASASDSSSGSKSVTMTVAVAVSGTNQIVDSDTTTSTETSTVPKALLLDAENRCTELKSELDRTTQKLRTATLTLQRNTAQNKNKAVSASLHGQAMTTTTEYQKLIGEYEEKLRIANNTMENMVFRSELEASEERYEILRKDMEEMQKLPHMSPHDPTTGQCDQSQIKCAELSKQLEEAYGKLKIADLSIQRLVLQNKAKDNSQSLNHRVLLSICEEDLHKTKSKLLKTEATCESLEKELSLFRNGDIQSIINSTVPRTLLEEQELKYIELEKELECTLQQLKLSELARNTNYIKFGGDSTTTGNTTTAMISSSLTITPSLSSEGQCPLKNRVQVEDGVEEEEELQLVKAKLLTSQVKYRHAMHTINMMKRNSNHDNDNNHNMYGNNDISVMSINNNNINNGDINDGNDNSNSNNNVEDYHMMDDMRSKLDKSSSYLTLTRDNLIAIHNRSKSMETRLQAMSLHDNANTTITATSTSTASIGMEGEEETKTQTPTPMISTTLIDRQQQLQQLMQPMIPTVDVITDDTMVYVAAVDDNTSNGVILINNDEEYVDVTTTTVPIISFIEPNIHTTNNSNYISTTNNSSNYNSVHMNDRMTLNELLSLQMKYKASEDTVIRLENEKQSLSKSLNATTKSLLELKGENLEIKCKLLQYAKRTDNHNNNSNNRGVVIIDDNSSSTNTSGDTNVIQENFLLRQVCRESENQMAQCSLEKSSLQQEMNKLQVELQESIQKYMKLSDETDVLRQRCMLLDDQILQDRVRTLSLEENEERLRRQWECLQHEFDMKKMNNTSSDGSKCVTDNRTMNSISNSIGKDHNNCSNESSERDDTYNNNNNDIDNDNDVDRYTKNIQQLHDNNNNNNNNNNSNVIGDDDDSDGIVFTTTSTSTSTGKMSRDMIISNENSISTNTATNTSTATPSNKSAVAIILNLKRQLQSAEKEIKELKSHINNQNELLKDMQIRIDETHNYSTSSSTSISENSTSMTAIDTDTHTDREGSAVSLRTAKKDEDKEEEEEVDLSLITFELQVVKDTLEETIRTHMMTTEQLSAAETRCVELQHQLAVAKKMNTAVGYVTESQHHAKLQQQEEGFHRRLTDLNALLKSQQDRFAMVGSVLKDCQIHRTTAETTCVELQKELSTLQEKYNQLELSNKNHANALKTDVVSLVEERMNRVGLLDLEKELLVLKERCYTLQKEKEEMTQVAENRISHSVAAVVKMDKMLNKADKDFEMESRRRRECEELILELQNELAIQDRYWQHHMASIMSGIGSGGGGGVDEIQRSG